MDGRPGLRRWAWGLLALGGLLAGRAGLRAASLEPSWFDPRDGPSCARSADGCPADIDAALTALWWWVGAGGVVALAGLVLLVRSLSAGRRPGPPAHPLLHAGLAGVAAGVAAAAVALPLLVTALISTHAVPLGLGVAWLTQAAVVAVVDHLFAGSSPRGALIVGLVAGLVAAGAVLLVLSGDRLPDAWPSVVVIDGAAVGLCVAVARAVGRRPGPGRRAEAGTVAASAVLLVAVVVGAVGGGAVVGGAVPASDPGRPAPPTSAEEKATPAPSVPAPRPAPEPAPAPAPPPAPVVAAEAPCATADLAFSVDGFDAATGIRATAVEATNRSATPCWVEGVPAVTLLQGGRPLSLTVLPGQAPSGGPAPVQRVGLAPRGSAFALLTWKPYGGLADDETPQAVTAALGGGEPQVPVAVQVGEAYRPAPFDLVDGAAWGIAPWAPPWN